MQQNKCGQAARRPSPTNQLISAELLALLSRVGEGNGYLRYTPRELKNDIRRKSFLIFTLMDRQLWNQHENPNALFLDRKPATFMSANDTWCYTPMKPLHSLIMPFSSHCVLD
jgi:hypothetical protein